MIYPYLTLNDGTEYTHSEMKADGTVLVYVETPDAEDGFHSLLCVLPKYEIKDVIGYTKDEQEKILARIKKNAHLINIRKGVQNEKDNAFNLPHALRSFCCWRSNCQRCRQEAYG